MITAIIQARTGSTRFPGKVFAKLAGKPQIWHVVERLRHCRSLGNIVLAIPLSPLNDELASWGAENKVEVFRGSEDDVLSRYYHAAKKAEASVVVRITADDPFKDPALIDDVVQLLQSRNLSFAYNNHPPSFPEGLDTEVFTFAALEQAYRDSEDPFEREHVTQYFYRHPEMFPQLNLSNAENLSHLRWTVDTPADYDMACRVYNELYRPGEVFDMNDILALLQRCPEIAAINSGEKRSAMYS